MKITLFQFVALIVVALNSTSLALDPNQISDYQGRLNNSDPTVRLTAMKELGDFADRSPEKAGNDVVTFLTKGLSDADSRVRYEAVSYIASISLQTLPRFTPQKSGMIDLRGYAPLKAALEKALFDPDVETRQNALGAYENLYEFAPELQTKLIVQFGVEKSGGIQEGIAEALATSSSPTKNTTDFLLKLLDDPKYAPRIAVTWTQIKGPPPSTALAKLAELLIKTPSASERQLFVSAIGKYGAQARPYLADIEKLRDKETDAVTRANLERAAEAIRTGKPLEE